MKRFLIAVLCVILPVAALLSGCGDRPDNSVELDTINAQIETWSTPEAWGRNDNFKVEVSGDGQTWQELEVYNVKNGHQLGDKLMSKAGATYFGTPYEAALVTFDFTGTAGIRVTYNNGTLAKGGYVISPDSYAVKSIQDGNEVTFTLTQDAESPRKAVFRPAGEWEENTLHIMTNVPEGSNAVSQSASNVYIVDEGEDIPLKLPAGKDTYYFKRGMHTLSEGYWADIDLGKQVSLKGFEIVVPVNLSGGLCFEIQAQDTSGAYQTVYESTGAAAESNKATVSGQLNVTASRIRLLLHGNFTYTPIGDHRFIMKSYIREFRLFDAGGSNVAQNKAVDGAGANYAIVTDGSEYTGDYGHDYAAETFSVFSGYTYYLEKGSVVYGSLIGKDVDGVTVKGRGILDSSTVTATHELSEARNSSIRFEYCDAAEISGITIMNAPMWMVIVNFGENLLVDGINLFGYCTNADGIHFSGSKNAVATGCFIRTTDDLFVAYHYGDADNLTFKNSVLWSDGARILLLGLATYGNISNVTMENCDVINYHNVWDLDLAGGMVHIVATGGKTISGITIKDIRVDEVRFPSIAKIMNIRAGYNIYGTGFVRDVTVENFSYASPVMPKGYIGVKEPGGSVTGVTFKNVTVEGKKVTAANLSDYFELFSADAPAMS